MERKKPVDWKTIRMEEEEPPEWLEGDGEKSWAGRGWRSRWPSNPRTPTHVREKRVITKCYSSLELGDLR